MTLTVSQGASAYEPCPAGTYPARCCALVDLGHQQVTFNDETKSAHKVLLQFEICDPEARRSDGTPHILSRRFTASLHERAALRALLEGWRGKPFTTEELRGFDLHAILGVAALATVTHATKGERTYANLASVTKPPRGLTVPAGELPALGFDLAAPDWQAFAALPSRVQEQIAESPEYAALTPPARVAIPAPAAAPVSPAPNAYAAAKAGTKPARAPAAPAAVPPAPPEDMADLEDADIPF